MSSLILQCTRLAADKLSLVFLKMALQLKFVVLSLPTDLDLLSVMLPVYQSSLLPPPLELAQGASRAREGVGLALGLPRPAGGIHG